MTKVLTVYLTHSHRALREPHTNSGQQTTQHTIFLTQETAELTPHPSSHGRQGETKGWPASPEGFGPRFHILGLFKASLACSGIQEK